MAVPVPRPPVAPIAVKLLVVGPFGAGKTTLVSQVSETEPLFTEAAITAVSTDDLAGLADKTTTTTAVDFGRLTLPLEPVTVIYLFGLPGQERFEFLWQDFGRGAAGAIVLADTRRLDHAFPILDQLDEQQMPYVVAVNQFQGAHRYSVQAVRDALGVTDAPVLACDARRRESAGHVVIALIEHIQRTLATPRTPRAGAIDGPMPTTPTAGAPALHVPAPDPDPASDPDRVPAFPGAW
jgi:signal recognition particle receptor subunit beta